LQRQQMNLSRSELIHTIFYEVNDIFGSPSCNPRAKLDRLRIDATFYPAQKMTA
jgi:hypothetical protein